MATFGLPLGFGSVFVNRAFESLALGEDQRKGLGRLLLGFDEVDYLLHLVEAFVADGAVLEDVQLRLGTGHRDGEVFELLRDFFEVAHVLALDYSLEEVRAVGAFDLGVKEARVSA
eukprot:CAMPEP_0170483446 /NCGR_PEP_ID=MMETSP0208-20121228/3114_1 /TAXON_ID=197538 /ORGANISM="Strombidium inclinatum, Strain S3" /LENGTH=115 /DNA_ID=CAMNT_0010756469 /DNA_START=922 /DNA_END=1265 /DNA_ORIENTATION=+